MRIICAFLMLMIMPSLSQADAKDISCTNRESVKIEKIVSQAKSWSEIYKYFRQYHDCEDENVVEVWSAYSEVIADLLNKRWDDFGELIKITSSDPIFEEFVIKHVSDQTLPVDVLKEVRKNAQKFCPARSDRFCKKLAAATY